MNLPITQTCVYVCLRACMIGMHAAYVPCRRVVVTVNTSAVTVPLLRVRRSTARRLRLTVGAAQVVGI